MKKQFFSYILFLFWLFVAPITLAQNILPPEQAFPYTLKKVGPSLIVDFSIPDGYYLYKDKFTFLTTPEGLIRSINFPPSQTHEDEFFGISEIYRSSFQIELLIQSTNADTIQLDMGLQGCADIGLCYPPQSWTEDISWSASFDTNTNLNRNNFFVSQNDNLDYSNAFQINARFDGPNLIVFNWVIEPGYYMYQQSFSFIPNESIQFGSPQYPRGEDYTDSYFGDVEIYRDYVEIAIPFNRMSPESFPININVNSQGCKDAGICYPPSTQRLNLLVPQISDFDTASSLIAIKPTQQSEQSFLADFLSNGAWLNVAISFFGFGVLLSFTPCVLPMIPILSGLIINPRHARHSALVLSIAYVLGMSITYTFAGILAALAGQQVQAIFQQPWIIGIFCLFFLILGLSMINTFNVTLPSSIQTSINRLMDRSNNGSIIGITLMGALSGLIVTACVVPPLIGALLAISESGNITRGAMSLFSMSLGMGLPLLLIGISAKKLLPKVGPWMNNIKSIIGLMLLATSVYLAGRILSIEIYQMLWGIFMLLVAISITKNIFYFSSKLHWLKFSISLFSLIYGSLIIYSSSMGGIGIMPSELKFTRMNNEPGVVFNTIDDIDDLSKYLALSSLENKPALLEITADWCVSCRELERYTFSDDSVINILQENFTLMQADVTDYNEADRVLLESVRSFGPPTILFYSASGELIEDLTLIGFISAEDFIRHIEVLL